MQKFVNVRTTAESVKPLEIDDYHVYVNTGIKEIHEEAKEGDLSSGFDGFEIETQEIYEKDEYIQLMAERRKIMAQVYATLIRKGLRTIDTIPKDLRKAVQKILDGDNE